MIARWDTLLLAAVLSVGAMLIEHSHRVDAGAGDDAFASCSEGACEDVQNSAPTAFTTMDAEVGVPLEVSASAGTDAVLSGRD